MPELNLDLNYCDHPKIKELQVLIDSTADIYPIRLWLYCGKFHTKDGALKGYTVEKIETKVLGWLGKRGKLLKSLLKVGIVERKSGVYLCHDWKVYQGHIEAMSERNRRAAQARWAKIKGNTEETGDAHAMQVHDSGMPNTNCGMPLLSVPSIPSVLSVEAKKLLEKQKAERPMNDTSKLGKKDLIRKFP